MRTKARVWTFSHGSAQMPIVDGLTSTKMIRSFEKTHSNSWSSRAALNGRVPIIAVSASLVEKLRQEYIDAGFDAWILKPISFARLNDLMTAIVDPNLREACLYQPGEWEKGGWFHMGQKSPNETSTAPSGKAPQSNLEEATEEAARYSDDPIAGDEPGQIPEEQARLLHAQDKGEGTHVHYEMGPEKSPESPTGES